MAGALSVNIRKHYIDRAGGLARQCTALSTRQRVLLTQAVALAVREHFGGTYNLPTELGRSGLLKYVELLDISDFRANDWFVEVRVNPSLEQDTMQVPTTPLMVGVLSDFYVCARVDQTLTGAEVLGFATREDLAGGELSVNGLFVTLPVEELREIDTLPGLLRERRSFDPEQLSAFERWQERADQIIGAVSEYIDSAGDFEPDQVRLLAEGLRDNILRIYGDRLPQTGLEPLFRRLFQRFGLEKPVPAPPGSPVAFRNNTEDKADFSDSGLRHSFFRDDLSVKQRVSLYRLLLEDEPALKEHLLMKRALDRATAGKHQTTQRQRERVKSIRSHRAERALPEPPTAEDRGFPVEEYLESAHGVEAHGVALPYAPTLDFSSDAETVRVVTEGVRLTYGHLFNPAFATEISLIDPLPHQRIAVYQHMLNQPRLRFLLADDAGAGKTIMTGLYIREMLTRRLIRRVLIVPPAGLAGNWEREMRSLFSLQFRVVAGAEAKNGNPFLGADSDLLIVKIDTLAGERMFSRLQEQHVAPYDLVIFDEAHKLSTDRAPDLTVRKTDRYKLAEAIAGVADVEDERWQLGWSARHLLLLTATPHMGKEYPYYGLWRLLEPEALSTIEAFREYPPDARRRHFIRRTKEEMVRYDGSRIYPERVSDTLSYDLTQGEVSEQALYDATTDYIQYYYNRARILNRSAARLAMSVFQRRLASSTYALMLSFQRRSERLGRIIDALRSGEITAEQLKARQTRLDRSDEVFDVFEEKTADEEASEEGREESELVEERLAGVFVSYTLAELGAELARVKGLYELARRVYEDKDLEDSKFQRLREIIRSPRYKDEKILIFTEHRDTLDFLVRRIEGLGFAGQVAQIHGGMDYPQRDEQLAYFRTPSDRGGARYMIATDAAGEGINMQFCWLMVNYDIPWNPARLEQRMGRIHRYGQKHDPVVILNLVAGKTREGRVLHTLLDKLELIRKALNTDKVFDVIGRVFQDISIKQYMEQVLEDRSVEDVESEIEFTFTEEQVEARIAQDRILYGDGGDVRSYLPDLREQLATEELRQVLPGYVRRFIQKAAPAAGIEIEGSLDGYFSMRGERPHAFEPLWPILEKYPPDRRDRMTVYRPDDPDSVIFMHPGEPFFDRFRAHIFSIFETAALKGGVFADPSAESPYTMHVAVVTVVRRADAGFKALATEEALDQRLVAFRVDDDGQISECEVDYLMMLTGANGAKPPDVSDYAASAQAARERVRKYARDNFALDVGNKRRQELLDGLSEREEFIRRGYGYEEAALAAERSTLGERVRAGDTNLKGRLNSVKERQRRLASRREEALTVLRREPELIEPGTVEFIAHALVVPAVEPEERKRFDARVEAIAVRRALSYEEVLGATVKDVSTPALAVGAGLNEHPGFDLLSRRPDGTELAIEVKGRAGRGSVELTENEWVKACNLRERYWLYVVFECATPHPHLVRVNDPFHKLIVKAKGGVIIDAGEILGAAERTIEDTYVYTV